MGAFLNSVNFKISFKISSLFFQFFGLCLKKFLSIFERSKYNDEIKDNYNTISSTI
ncbi:MAG: hypothetical protein PWQ96_1140 [Clostridia bacterium]|jgi:hypothetical protein|nr:hypothetical protein [Clostridiales bacterium]MDK2985498.1 hypothetical protein [Clostridia bacterium]